MELMTVIWDQNIFQMEPDTNKIQKGKVVFIFTVINFRSLSLKASLIESNYKATLP